MVSCCVFGCTSKIRNEKKCNYSEEIKALRFFYIPKDPAIRKQWILAAKRKDSFNPDSARFCSKHFKDDDFEISFKHSMVGGRMPKLKKEAVPSVNLPNSMNLTQSSINRDARHIHRDQKVLVKSLLQENPPVILENPKSPSPVKKKVSLKTECIRRLKKKNYDLERKLRKSMLQLHNLERKLNKMFTPGQLKLLKSSDRRVNWSTEDISSAIALHAAGSSLYNLLRKRGFPFPGPSTLRSWAKDIDVEPGISSSVVSLMNTIEYTDYEKRQQT